MSTLSFIHHPSTNTGTNVIITQETSKMLPWWAVSTEDHMMHHRVQASERCDFFLNQPSVVGVPEDTSLNKSSQPPPGETLLGADDQRGQDPRADDVADKGEIERRQTRGGDSRGVMFFVHLQVHDSRTSTHTFRNVPSRMENHADHDWGIS